MKLSQTTKLTKGQRTDILPIINDMYELPTGTTCAIFAQLFISSPREVLLTATLFTGDEVEKIRSVLGEIAKQRVINELRKP